MSKASLDFTAVWNDTTEMLQKHKEAGIAIAGLFLFLPSWMFAYFIGEPDFVGVTTLTEQLEVQGEFYQENWFAFLVTSIATAFGTLAYYIVLTHGNIGTIGSALSKAIKIFPLFFIVSIITNFLTGLGLFAFLIGAFYLMGRFSTVAGVLAAESERGVIGSIQYAWSLTNGLGWMSFLMILIVVVVGFVIIFVIEAISSLIFGLIGGTMGQLLTTGVSSLIGMIFSLVIATLMIAIYKHLKPQVDKAAKAG